METTCLDGVTLTLAAPDDHESVWVDYNDYARHEVVPLEDWTGDSADQSVSAAPQYRVIGRPLEAVMEHASSTAACGDSSRAVSSPSREIRQPKDGRFCRRGLESATSHELVLITGWAVMTTSTVFSRQVPRSSPSSRS